MLIHVIRISHHDIELEHANGVPYTRSVKMRTFDQAAYSIEEALEAIKVRLTQPWPGQEQDYFELEHVDTSF